MGNAMKANRYGRLMGADWPLAPSREVSPAVSMEPMFLTSMEASLRS